MPNNNIDFDKDKALSFSDLGKIMTEAIEGDTIDCGEQYESLMADVAKLIADNFGGKLISVDYNPEYGGWHVFMRRTEEVPSDGGVYKDFCKHVNWEVSDE